VALAEGPTATKSAASRSSGAGAAAASRRPPGPRAWTATAFEIRDIGGAARAAPGRRKACWLLRRHGVAIRTTEASRLLRPPSDHICLHEARCGHRGIEAEYRQTDWFERPLVPVAFRGARSRTSSLRS